MFLRLKLLATYFLSKKKKMPQFDKTNKKIIVALAANYGNLGDVAITYAQKQFLKKNFPEYDVIEFEISNTFTGMKSLKPYIRQDDIITIVGGGNFGDVYDDIEFARQFIIYSFPKNKIVIFPQTIVFSKTLLGRLRLLLAKAIYNSHKDLTIFVREAFSYEKYSSVFRRIEKAPDIVMSMDYVEPDGLERDGIVVCFRDDKENGVDMYVKDLLVSEIRKQYCVQTKDTHVGNKNNLRELYLELHNLIGIFQKSRVVVTDRLHGMILSYITHTPCVALCGGNKKILGCYQWIAESNYVRLIESDICADNLETVLQEIDRLYKVKTEEKQCVNLDHQFDGIQKAIAER